MTLIGIQHYTIVEYHPSPSSHMDPKDRGSLHAIRRSARLNHIHPTGGLTEKSPSYKFLVARSLSPQPVSWRLKKKIRGEKSRFRVETMVPSKLSLKQSY